MESFRFLSIDLINGQLTIMIRAEEMKKMEERMERRRAKLREKEEAQRKAEEDAKKTDAQRQQEAEAEVRKKRRLEEEEQQRVEKEKREQEEKEARAAREERKKQEREERAELAKKKREEQEERRRQRHELGGQGAVLKSQGGHGRFRAGVSRPTLDASHSMETPLKESILLGHLAVYMSGLRLVDIVGPKLLDRNLKLASHGGNP